MNTATIQEKKGLEEGHRDPSFLTEQQHRKALIKNIQRQMKTLAEMKEEEKEEEISQGRKKWFNEEIDQLREKIRDLEQGGNQ